MSARPSLLVRLWKTLTGSKSPAAAPAARLSSKPAPLPARVREARPRIEALEGRIAPATLLPGGKALSYTDGDGDHVTITFSKAIFPTTAVAEDSVLSSVFTFSAGKAHSGASNSTDDVPQNLQTIDLTAVPNIGSVNPVSGLSFTISVQKAGNGNGQADIGAIKATGLALGSISIAGDLGQIDCGSNSVAMGLKALKVESLGVSTTSQGASPTYESTVVGEIGSLTAGTVHGVYIHAVNGSASTSTGAASVAVGSIGTLNIAHQLAAGSTSSSAVDDGLIQTDGGIGSVTIGSGTAGDGMVGGAGVSSGTILSGGSIGKILIKGSVLGGTGDQSAAISAAGNVASYTVVGSVHGSDGASSASLVSGGNLGNVAIGTAANGGLYAGIGDSSGTITSSGNIGLVTIVGDIQGLVTTVAGDGTHAGGISAMGKIGGLTVSGSLRGGSDIGSGFVESTGAIGAVKIGGGIYGGAGEHSGAIVAGGNMTSLTIGQSLTGSSGLSSGSVNVGTSGSGTLGTAKISDGIFGGGGDFSGLLDVEGNIASVQVARLTPANAATAAISGGAGSYSGGVYADGAISTLIVSGTLKGDQGGHSGSLEWHGINKTLTVGNILGGAGAQSGTVTADDFHSSASTSAGLIGTATVAGLAGGIGNGSGVITSAGNVTSLKITGAMIAGSTAGTGRIETGGGFYAPGNIGTLSVQSFGAPSNGGTNLQEPTIEVNGSLTSFTAGSIISAELHVGGALGSLTVNGSVNNALVTAAGGVNPAAATDLAIGKITIAKDVSFSQFEAGYSVAGDPVNGHAQIGAVTVGGSWTASNLVAGVKQTNAEGFGAAGNAEITGGAASNVISKISSVIIKGTVNGSGSNQYGFVAAQIGSFKVGTTTEPLTAAPGQVIQLLPADSATEVTVREVS